MARFFVLFAALFSLWAAPAYAQEVIENYAVGIGVEQSGDIIVQEQITVVSEGREIQRGIFRELPRYLDVKGQKLETQYDVLSVTRGGASEPFRVLTNGNALTIRIGQSDVILPPDTYTYVITYRVQNQIRHFDDFDELYWNATGTFWNFPILKASASVTLPQGARALEHNAYTGRRGSTAQNYTHSLRAGLNIFQTTTPLARKEGLTLSLTLPKGVIDPPSAADKRAQFWTQYKAPIALFSAIAALFGWLLSVWNKVGRDPVKGPIIPLYGPPEGYSAAAAQTIYAKSVPSDKALIATLLSLAHKGFITIDSSKKTTVISTDAALDFERLNPQEHKLLALLFDGSADILTLKRQYNARFTKAHNAFKKHLKAEFGDRYFKSNGGVKFASIVISIFILMLTFLLMDGQFTRWIFIGYGLLVAIVGVFSYLLSAPTQKGQAVRTHIEGFRLYLKTAEEKRLNAVDINSPAPPPMTVARYEAFLPYAIALGVEKPWTQQFEDSLPLEAEHYRPKGVTGDYASAGSLSGMTKSLVSNMSSGVSAAQPQSSSSSGSSGGGSSGGGGGGGGGGGW